MLARKAPVTNGFSKKIGDHCCAVALNYMHYNFGRIHKTLRVTPAMEGGIDNRVWTMKEVVMMADTQGPTKPQSGGMSR